MDDIYTPNASEWIKVAELIPPDPTVPCKQGRFVYQKIVNGNPAPLVISTDTDCGAPDWRTWRERETGMSWAEIAEQYKGMTRC